MIENAKKCREYEKKMNATWKEKEGGKNMRENQAT